MKVLEENKILETIGERIKYLRETNNLTQKDLAEKTNISRGNLSNYEKDRFKPASDSIISLAEFFSVSTYWILTGEINNNSISPEDDKLIQLLMMKENINKDLPENINTIGKRIKFLRVKSNLSITELSDNTGIKKSGLSSYENDLYEPSAKALVTLSNVFNVSTDWLLAGKKYYGNVDVYFWVEYNSLSDYNKNELKSFINYLKYKDEIGGNSNEQF